MKDTKRSYSRLCRLERVAIERGIEHPGGKRMSARAIAASLGRSPSTISSEVRTNRIVSRGQGKGGRVDGSALPEKVCDKLLSWPWVCNGCRYRRYHCTYTFRCEYSAARADALAHETLSLARRGVDVGQAEFEHMMGVVRADLSRGLSPAQICAGRASDFRISPSTLYRWIASGYGGMSNMDLRRKVGYRPRRRSPEARPTSHGEGHSYKAFLSLPPDRSGAACEMDTVVGRARDSRCILTLFLRPCRFQMCLLLPEKTSSAVTAALDSLEGALGGRSFRDLFGLILTDNGAEFSDVEAIERSFLSGRRTQVYYCDARQSQQKAGCERNHVELRKIIPKGRGIPFDDLTQRDMAVLMSHLNSQPRPSLLGSTPIEALLGIGGHAGNELIELLSISRIPFDELDMTPAAIDRERADRGLPSLLG